MRDLELRRILEEVMTEIDSGKIRVKKRRFSTLKAALAPAILSVGMGLAAAGCDGRAVGAADEHEGPSDASYVADAEQRPDAGSVDAYQEPDSGFMPVYGEPFPEEEDASIPEDASLPYEALYSAPF